MAGITPRSSEGYSWTPTGSVEGLETSAAIVTPQICSTSYDVVVIGSGFAGLVAARELSQKGKAKILLIEARDRIGGRTWTANVSGEKVEMGGTWVHWNQPHVYNEIHRYGLHAKLKTSSGTLLPETQYYKPAVGAIQSVSPLEVNEISERVAARMFQIDGHTSRTLMPYPHDPLREPAPWKAYDHLSVRQRLDQLHDTPQAERNIFEAITGSFGSAPGTDTAFLEALRWYALGGHSMAGMFELAGIYKIGGGGMTSLALAILGDYKGDILLNTPVQAICQTARGVTIETKSGKSIKAATVISTIPLYVSYHEADHTDTNECTQKLSKRHPHQPTTQCPPKPSHPTRPHQYRSQNPLQIPLCGTQLVRLVRQLSLLALLLRVLGPQRHQAQRP